MTDTPDPALPENPPPGSAAPAPPPHDRSAPPPGGTGRGRPDGVAGPGSLPGQRGGAHGAGPSRWDDGGTGTGGPGGGAQGPGGPGQGGRGAGRGGPGPEGPGPGGGPGLGRPGWGGGPGWGGPGWGGPPPAPQPGIIPLRPLDLGDVLGGAFRLMRSHWRAVLGISLGAALLVVAVTLVVQGTTSVGTTTTYGLGSVPAQFVALLGSTLAVGMLTSVASHAVLGRPLGLRAAWREVRPRFWKLLGVTVLVSLVLTASVLVCLVPGLLVAAAGGGDGLTVLGVLGGAVLAIWLYIRLSFSTAALVLERQGVVASMRRSAKLVRGAWWRTFGILLLTGLIASVAQFVIMLPFDALGLLVSLTGPEGDVTDSPALWLFLGAGMVVSTTFVFPLTAGVTVLLYVDQRIRHESLDIDLAAATATRPATPGHP